MLIPLTTQQIANALGIPPRRVREWCISGMLKSTKSPSAVGKGHYMVFLKDFDAFVDKYKQRPEWKQQIRQAFKDTQDGDLIGINLDEIKYTRKG